MQLQKQMKQGHGDVKTCLPAVCPPHLSSALCPSSSVQCYTDSPANTAVVGGNLVITAFKNTGQRCINAQVRFPYPRASAPTLAQYWFPRSRRHCQGHMKTHAAFTPGWPGSGNSIVWGTRRMYTRKTSRRRQPRLPLHLHMCHKSTSSAVQ